MLEDAIIKVEHLSHRYDVQWAVRDVNFEITQKGIYGLLGSNGAGKSTIMNIICGVIKPTEGVVLVKGTDITRDPTGVKCHIGFLPQKPPLYDELTVEEYLTHAAELRCVPDKEVKKTVSDVMGLCAISHFRKRLLKNLSGGYQQRVGIAQAIIHKPDIVIFDEPTNGLDPNQILDIRRLIKGIAEEHTVILSTHILSEVQAICDYIFMIDAGQVVFTGSVNDFDNYILPSTIYVDFAEKMPGDKLEHIPGVLQVEHVEKNRYRIRFSDANEVMEHLVEEAAANCWRMCEMRLEKISLDHVFAELSKKKR